MTLFRLKDEYLVLRVFTFVCSLFACIVMAMTYINNDDGKNYDNNESYGFYLFLRCIVTVYVAADITRRLSRKLPTDATKIHHLLLLDYFLDQLLAYDMVITAACGESFLASRMRKEEDKKIFFFAIIMAFLSAALCALISGYNLSNYRNFSITNT